MTTYRDFLKSAAQSVETQVADNPLLGIPVDPDVADFMGAFEEDPAVMEAIGEETEEGITGDGE